MTYASVDLYAVGWVLCTTAFNIFDDGQEPVKSREKTRASMSDGRP
jgi:hypothetical protein